MNNVDRSALIASKTIDLTNLRTTPTANINFVNSYGVLMISLDDEGNFVLVGTHLNCSGDVIFTNGINVSNGVNLSYDLNTALNMDSTGSHIIGPLSVSGLLKANGGLSSNSITIGGSVSSAAVAVTGSGAFFQDLSATSLKLTGAQAPITQTRCRRQL